MLYRRCYYKSLMEMSVKMQKLDDPLFFFTNSHSKTTLLNFESLIMLFFRKIQGVFYDDPFFISSCGRNFEDIDLRFLQIVEEEG